MLTQKIRCFAIPFLLLLCLPLVSNALDELDDDSLFGSSLSTEPAEQEEFLRVEQAYQALVEQQNDALTVDWSIATGYYLYQHQFKIEVKNNEVKETLAFTSTPGKKKFDEYFNKELEVHYFNARLEAKAPTLAAPYEIVIKSQGCADAGLCYPPRKQYFQVDASGGISESDGTRFEGPKTPDSTEQAADPTVTEEPPLFIVTLLFAIMGGLILNLMPCVFPVLSLKALSFTSAPQDGKQHHHGWAYTAGVIGSFVVVAAVMLAARSAGQSLGWGFQLQHPGFVAAMAYLFFIMGLSLSGLINFGSQFMGVGQSLTTGSGLKSSFFTGVLAAVVASPCTAPFMASALGYALTLPAYVALCVFIALGFGMALPFLLLSYSPALAKYLPAPGAWMDTLKQFLAFPLYLTSIWLLWVLGHQTTSDGTVAIVLGALMIVFALWLIQQKPKSTATKTITGVSAAACVIFAGFVLFHVSGMKRETNPVNNEQWQHYTPDLLSELREEGKPVFINLTADWCITCKVNETVALSSNTFFERASEKGITLIKGDYTNSNPEITKLLKKFNRSGVPLYIVYPEDGGEPELLPQILAKSIVMDALDRAVPANTALAKE